MKLKNRITSLIFILSSLPFVLSCSGDSAASTADDPIADTTPDYRASVPPNDTYSYPGSDEDRGTWSGGTMPDGNYDKDAFVAFDDRDYDVEDFETYGYMHPSANQFPWIGQDCGIPRSATLQPAIRRWTSKFAGTIKIEGSVGMDTEHQDLGGTGTRVTLYVDGVEKYSKDLDGASDTQYDFEVEDIQIENGSVVDFAVEAIDATSRIANFTAQIYLVDEE